MVSVYYVEWCYFEWCYREWCHGDGAMLSCAMGVGAIASGSYGEWVL